MKPCIPVDTLGVPRVDGCRVINSISHVICNDLRWKDTPAASLHKIPLQSFPAWAEKGVSHHILVKLVGMHANEGAAVPDSPHMKAHRTAARLLLKKRLRRLERTRDRLNSKLYS